MPLVFVHGVNVRDNDTYREEVALRNELLLNVFFPLLGRRSSADKLFDAYWGDLAPDHRPGQLFLPHIAPLSLSNLFRKQLDGAAQETSLSGDETERPESLLQMLRVEPLTRVLDDLIAFAADERGAHIDLQEHSRNISQISLRALRLAGRLSTMELQQKWLHGLSNDEELLQKLETELADDENPEVSSAKRGRFKHSREALNKTRIWLRQNLQLARGRMLKSILYARRMAKAKVESARGKVRQATSRVAARTIMSPAREFFHSRLANFIGDAFFYFGKRGSIAKPGPVPERVISMLSAANEARSDQDSQLIVIAHSMGGIVMCDVVSYFRPDIQIDCLITVGSQFPLFADLRMFPGYEDYAAPPLPRPDLVKAWINLFDPNDFLGFAAEKLFDGIVDFQYCSGRVGAATHADYFKFPSFYQSMARAVATIATPATATNAVGG